MSKAKLAKIKKDSRRYQDAFKFDFQQFLLYSFSLMLPYWIFLALSGMHSTCNYPSYMEIGSTEAQLGNHYFDKPAYTSVKLEAAPEIINGKLYLPVDFVAMAAGVSRDRIFTDSKNLLLVISIKNTENNGSIIANEDNKDNEKILYIIGKEKTIKIDQTKFNLSDEIILKNNTVLMSENWLSKLFKVSIIKNGKKITIKHCEFF